MMVVHRSQRLVRNIADVEVVGYIQAVEEVAAVGNDTLDNMIREYVEEVEDELDKRVLEVVVVA